MGIGYDYEVCGENIIGKDYASYAINFAGLKEGDCPSLGFTKYFDDKGIKVPMMGELSIKIYKKLEKKDLDLNNFSHLI
jgi:hypothetical protein